MPRDDAAAPVPSVPAFAAVNGDGTSDYEGAAFEVPRDADAAVRVAPVAGSSALGVPRDAAQVKDRAYSAPGEKERKSSRLLSSVAPVHAALVNAFELALQNLLLQK